MNLQCPWCGAERVESSAYLNSVNFKMWRAKCLNCGATGPSHNDSDDAMKAWNKRKDQPMMYEVIQTPLERPKEPEEKIQVKAKLEPEWRIKRIEELQALALRMWEMYGHCLCAGDLKCTPCKLRDVLSELRVRKGD